MSAAATARPAPLACVSRLLILLVLLVVAINVNLYSMSFGGEHPSHTIYNRKIAVWHAPPALHMPLALSPPPQPSLLSPPPSPESSLPPPPPPALSDTHAHEDQPRNHIETGNGNAKSTEADDDTSYALQRLTPVSQCLLVTQSSGSNIVTGTAEEASSPSLDLLVLILSSQQEHLNPAARRQAVRHSWAFATANASDSFGGEQPPDGPAAEPCSVRHLFVVGGGSAPAHLAGAQTAPDGDVLILPVPDGYRQIVHKVIGAVQWAVSSTRFKYLLKTDDDSFVCVSRLLETLRTMPRRRLYLGVVNPQHSTI